MAKAIKFIPVALDSSPIPRSPKKTNAKPPKPIESKLAESNARNKKYIQEIGVLKTQIKKLREQVKELKVKPDYSAANKIKIENEKKEARKRIRADYFYRIWRVLYQDKNMSRTSSMASFMVLYCRQMRYNLTYYAIFHVCRQYDYFNWTDLRLHGFLKKDADSSFKFLVNKGWISKINTYPKGSLKAKAAYYVNSEGKKQYPHFILKYRQKMKEVEAEVRQEIVENRWDVIKEREAAIKKILGEIEAYGYFKQYEKKRERRDRQLHSESGESHPEL